MKRIMLTAAVLPLAACMTVTPDDARFVTYSCERGGELHVVYAGNIASIRHPDGTRTDLQRITGPDGTLFSSATRTIRGEGSTITYTVGRAAPQTCTALDPPA